MEDYNKIIESLSVKFIKAKFIKILQPVTVNNYYDIANSLMLLHKGSISFGEKNEVVEEGDILFISSGHLTSVTYGQPDPAAKPSNVNISANMDKYLVSADSLDDFSENDNTFSLISLEAKAFESVNFFQSLDIPPFIIRKNEKITQIINETIQESYATNIPGIQSVIKLNTDRVVVEIYYICDKKPIVC